MGAEEFSSLSDSPSTSLEHSLRLQLVAEEVAPREARHGGDLRDSLGGASRHRTERRESAEGLAAARRRDADDLAARGTRSRRSPGGRRRRAAGPRRVERPLAAGALRRRGEEARELEDPDVEVGADRRPGDLPRRARRGRAARGGRTAPPGSESETKVWRLSASAESRSARSRSFESGKEGRIASSELIETSSRPSFSK